MKAGDLDQLADLWLGAAHDHLRARLAQTPGNHGEVDHQARIGELEVGEVDDEVFGQLLRTRQRGTP